MNHKLESKLRGKMSNNIRYADDITLMAESEEELKRLLMRLKDESEKAGLKIMASSPITSWQIDGGKMETVTDFISLGSKITADGDCNHKIKTLAPWKKSNKKPRQCIKKQKHHFADKVRIVKTMFFSSNHVRM